MIEFVYRSAYECDGIPQTDSNPKLYCGVSEISYLILKRWTRHSGEFAARSCAPSESVGVLCAGAVQCCRHLRGTYMSGHICAAKVPLPMITKIGTIGRAEKTSLYPSARASWSVEVLCEPRRDGGGKD